MSDTLILLTGLYDDQDLLSDVLMPAGDAGNKTELVQIEPASMSVTEWDNLVEKILSAERVMTL